MRFLAPKVAVLRAGAGMVPPGQSDVNPAVNVIQATVTAGRDGRWRIALFQNTPAQFHGRPGARSEPDRGAVTGASGGQRRRERARHQALISARWSRSWLHPGAGSHCVTMYS